MPPLNRIRTLAWRAYSVGLHQVQSYKNAFWNHQFSQSLSLEERQLFQKLSSKDQSYLRKTQKKPIAIITLQIEQLVSENNESRSIFYELNGTDAYCMKDLHMYGILMDYLEKGRAYVDAHFQEYDYVKFYQKLNHQEQLTPDFLHGLKLRFEKLLSTYHNIQKQGYLGGAHSQHYILVQAEEPPSQRFEVLSGHHRSCILQILGIQQFPVMLVKEV